MLNGVNLKKTGQGWRFANEAALEDFIWANLKPLFNLTPLKRQYYVKGEVCDILAVDDNKQLVVLELKNTEDRYIVQQLTRYYDALLEVKPFQAEVDYDKAMRLVAVAPSFHRHNDIDRRHNKLSFVFFHFSLIEYSLKLYFSLKKIDSEQVSEVEIPYPKRDIPVNIPEPPKALQKILSECESSKQQQILKIRNKILSFDERMEEIATAGSIKYGKGRNSKFCTEICIDSKHQPVLFLWLPLSSSEGKRLGRMKIWTDWDNYSSIEGYVPKGLRTKGISKTKQQRQRQSEMNVFWHPSGGIMFKIGSKQVSEVEWKKEEERRHKEYQNAIKARKSLNELVNIALEIWGQRL